MKKIFYDDFLVEYQKLCKKQHVAPTVEDPTEQRLEGAKEPEAAVAAGSAASNASATANLEADKTAFQKDIEVQIGKEVESRMVILTKDGKHGELASSISGTELYRNLESHEARFVGIYDVKCARLAEVYESQNVFKREPLIDKADFEEFLTAMGQIVKQGVDFLWVLAGREYGGAATVMECLHDKGFKYNFFYLNYDTKLMERHYWKRCRGLANSRSVEQLFLCWLGPPSCRHARGEVLPGPLLQALRGGHQQGARDLAEGYGLGGQGRP